MIQRLYDLGANFKPPLLAVRCMHERIKDPLYQLIKHQVRDVTQRDIEEFRRKADALQKGQSIAAVKVEEEAQPRKGTSILGHIDLDEGGASVRLPQPPPAHAPHTVYMPHNVYTV